MEMAINKTKNLKRKMQNRGFSFVELLVAVAIFSTLILAMSNIMLSMARTQRIIFSLQNTQEAGRFILESITKEMRTSTFNSLSGDGTTLSLTNEKGDIEYVFDNSNNLITREGVRISPTNVEITGRFYAREYTNPDHVVVNTVMKVETTMGKEEEQKELYLQSSVALR